MNLEELKNLKKDIDKAKSMKYIPLSAVYKKVDYSKAKTKEELIANDDTDRMVEQFERLMEIGTRKLLEEGVIFNFVQIMTSADYLVDGLYCEKYAAINNNEYLSDEMRSKEIDDWFKNVKEHALTDYTSIRLILDDEIYRNNEDIFIEFKKVGFIDKFTGIVNIEKFISKINDLGYIATFDDCYSEDTFVPTTADEFIKMSLEDTDDLTFINFIADFREKEKTDNVIK